MLSFKNSFKLHRFSYLCGETYTRLFTSLSSSSTKLNLSMQTFMKYKQYQKALDLFEQNAQCHNDISVNMAITACTQLKAYQRGLNIVKQLSSQTLDNHSVRRSLFDFYVRSNNLENAHRIFSTTKNKSNFMYTTIFKDLVSNRMSEKVLDLLDTMTIQPNEFTLAIAFKACAQVKNERAKKIGNQLFKQMPSDFRNDTVLINSAISMMMNFGDVATAEQLFESITRKDIVSYGAMIKGYVTNGMSEKALDLFERLSINFHHVISIIIFNACAQLKNQRARNIGKQLIDEMLKIRRTDQVLLTSALHMLMNFGDVERAEQLFHLIKRKDIVSYGAMMKGYVENGMAEKALNLFEQVSVNPDNAIHIILFDACAQMKNERAINIGKKLIDDVLKKSMTNHVTLTSAIHMLMSFGDVEGAQHLYGLIEEKNVVTYGAMMKGYVKNHMSEKALDLFEEIAVEKDDVIYTIIFKACAQMKNERAINIGKKLMDEMLKKSMTNQVVLTSAIHMLMSFGDVNGAEHLFQSIEKKSTDAYAAMMRGYIGNDMSEKVLDLFEQMSVIPDNIIFTTILTTCAKLKNERARKIGKQLLDQISNMSEPDNFLLHSAVNMLMKFGDVKGAERLFELIREKNVISYGAIMQGYFENGMSEKVLDLFEQMSIDPDDVIYSIVFKACSELANERAIVLGRKLLHQIFNESKVNDALLTSTLYMLMRFGDVKRAEHLFASIKNKDTLTYASMMKAYNLNRQPLQCLQLFQTMKRQDLATDNEVVFSLSINACSQVGILAICQSMVAQIPSYLHSKERISNALIDMWGKAGSVKNAQEIFTTIHHPTIVTCSSMINAFGLNGRGLEAVDLFRQIPYSIRNELCYIYALNSCSHAGLLNEARAIFDQINVKTKRITTTMIDCLSRLFLFDEAQKVLANYEKANTPCLPMYMAIISGARNCRDPVVSENFYNRMKTLFPDQKNALISGSILLANIYSSLGDDEQVEIIQSNRRMNYGNKIKPGLTWTEKDGEMVEFTAHDHSHPLASEIHDESKQMQHEMYEHGFRSDPSWITRPLGEDETIDSVLCGHSEKLAIAFHFIRRRRPSFIQVTKNLRICGDCHQATKFIAKFRQCEIILRDANRVHHFSKDGTCSCQDHF